VLEAQKRGLACEVASENANASLNNGPDLKSKLIEPWEMFDSCLISRDVRKTARFFCKNIHATAAELVRRALEYSKLEFN
jgi:hypothetical protein